MSVLGLEDAVRRVASAFAGYNAEFRAVTRRAQPRFEARDWLGAQQDATERIDLYDSWVNRTVDALRTDLGAAATDRAFWRTLRDRFAQRSAGLPDAAFARTFFSSVSRRLFGTVGVDPDIEFAAVDLDPLEGAGNNPETRRYDNRGDFALLIEDLLDDLPLRCPWIDFDSSVRHIAQEVAQHLRAAGLEPTGWTRALYVPPLPWLAGWAEGFEQAGSRLWPPLSGLILMEAVKQTLALQPRPERASVRRRTARRGATVGASPQPAGRRPAGA